MKPTHTNTRLSLQSLVSSNMFRGCAAPLSASLSGDRLTPCFVKKVGGVVPRCSAHHNPAITPLCFVKKVGEVVQRCSAHRCPAIYAPLVSPKSFWGAESLSTSLSGDLPTPCFVKKVSGGVQRPKNPPHAFPKPDSRHVCNRLSRLARWMACGTSAHQNEFHGEVARAGRTITTPI